ncbi:MAG: bifunctional chorismate mutase/prephenate dehydratase [Chloroflexota bacterium]|nr:bifunctional chorismate mutase/prephenate dehydratase [Chloroflexota bacterium]
MNVGYQGLAGAYSEAAAAALFPRAELAPRRTFADVFAALESGDADAAVVPVENTHAGPVADVYDLLRHRGSLRIVAEAIVRVRHCLLGVGGATLGGVRVARSHPQALAQVEEFLRARGIEPEVAFDTAGAAAEVAAGGDATIAAVASRRAAARYGLSVLAESIETATDNFTRFFALASNGAERARDAVPERLRGGTPKTSLVYATANIPGGLLRSLQPFATAGLQLTKIESRPSGDAPWDYVFYLDFEGDPRVSPSREAVALMRTCCAWVQELGTYPAATEVLEPD